MRSSFFLSVPALLSFAVAACSVQTGSETTDTNEQATTSCSAEYAQCGGASWTGPTCCVSGSACVYSSAYYSQCLPSSGSSSSSSAGSSSSSSSSSAACPTGSNVAVQQAAASLAYTILRAASTACEGTAENGSFGGPCWGTSILNSQRYSVSGSSIALTSDPVFASELVTSHPTQANQIRAALAVAQLNSSVASFLVQGLQWAQANTNGQEIAVSIPIEALASFTYPGNSTPIVVQDGSTTPGNRNEVVSGSAWCGTEDIHFADTSKDESGFAPFNVIPFTSTGEPSGNAPGYTGGNPWPSTPFNGPGGGSNPFLVIAVNGSQINWNSSSWPVENCPSSSCSGTIDFDPIPYTQPAPYYNANGLVGPESNPFTLVLADQWADSSNAGTWATEIVGGTTHGGTFSNGATYFGITVYGYVQQY